MKPDFTKKRLTSLILAAAGMVFAAGQFGETNAQTRDPFAKPGWAQPKVARPAGSAPTRTTPAEKPKPAAPMPVGAPPIQDRIAYYKRMREQAAMNNQPIPKVTSVLTLEEMSVTGIFKTPRGFAAMVEAKPIKLSYTIYPGEKFFDGQLVAIEENRLVFRKVAKMSNGKFIASEENKPLRQYTVEQEVQGTAPVEPAKTETAAVPPASVDPAAAKPAAPGVVISPLEEMLRQPTEKSKDSAKEKPAAKNKKGKSGASTSKKTAKKPEKVAAANQ